MGDMLRFELHSHSTYSKRSIIPVEGLSTPEEMIRSAKKKNLQGLALTDHDTVKGHKRARKEAEKQGIVFIPGIEVSTASGHIIGLGVEEEIKSNLSVEETVENIRQSGGLAVAVHPYDLLRNGIGNKLKLCDVVEIFNSFNIDRFANGKSEKTAEKLKMPRTVGSDAHSASMVGTSVNIMKACDLDSALKCIKKNKLHFEKKYTPVSELVDWWKIRLSVSYEDVLNYINTNWSAPKRLIGKFLLNKFTHSNKTTRWYILGHACLVPIIIYSGLKFKIK